MPSTLKSTALGLGLALTLLVSGCGGSDGSGGSGGSGSSGSSSGAASPGAGGSPQMDPEQLQAIQSCLEAAGLASAMPSGGPSGMPSDLPSDTPSEMPSGSGFPGGGGGQLNDPKVQKALEACGIDLPTPSR